MDSSSLLHSKEKVVFVLGVTGSGKSKLAIALAKCFNGEVVNSDKMQVYDGIPVITNKVTEEEKEDVPHHLIGGVNPEGNFTAADFRREATRLVEAILARGRLPIIAGGSNSYVKKLVEGDGCGFRSRYDCCFVWVDVDLTVLRDFVYARVDKMVELGLVEEARSMFKPDGDYSTGIRLSIGVREMHLYFQSEEGADEETKARLLEASLDKVKANTFDLTCGQLQKIQGFRVMGWDLHRVDSTEFFRQRGQGAEEELWKEVVWAPSAEIVRSFLATENKNETDVVAEVAPVKVEDETVCAEKTVEKESQVAAKGTESEERRVSSYTGLSSAMTCA
ncbi:unnamed protein product [Musa acuminata subsp. malaccensis]|uniref:(wild Malaysian banana) hypothetical protein n=1 Tax=Musa acuminata subsp. malaccensis TaxID=214687 RepID=A0A804J209_MUSAM|nr:PREDICTED: adenylate isopentenyltransferase 7, mitochondrial-like [Musa acuminata subsp. malaccensis]CAG1837822.1 unnamed protein product [Musa acuminata subsp. malaccensis]